MDAKWRNLPKLEVSGLKELVEQTCTVLDKLWSYGKGEDRYPAARMTRLIDVISNALIQRIQIEFRADELWAAEDSNVKMRLSDCSR